MLNHFNIYQGLIISYKQTSFRDNDSEYFSRYLLAVGPYNRRLKTAVCF